MLRGIVTADWHVDGMNKVFPKGDATARQLNEIRKIYKYAGDHQIEHVFIPGDLSDKTTLSQSELIQVITLFLQFDDHFKTYYIGGNHDWHSFDTDGDGEVKAKTSLDVLRLLVDNGFLKNLKIFYKPEMLKIDGVNIAMMPFPYNDVPVHANGKPPLVFAHLEAAGAIGDNGRPLKHGNDDAFKRIDGDFILSGHIHLFQHLMKKRFAYCGSPYQKNFGESLPKGFIDFSAKYVKGKLKVDVEFINNKPQFVLEQKLIQESKDWETLIHDESVRYKILLGEGVVPPKNIMREFPNIVYLNGAHTSVKTKDDGSVDTSSTLTVQDLPQFSTKTGLTKFLKSADLSKPEVKRAKSFVNEAMEALGLH